MFSCCQVKFEGIYKEILNLDKKIIFPQNN